MHKILAKTVRSKHTQSELVIVSLHFAEELESIKTDFDPESDTQLKACNQVRISDDDPQENYIVATIF